jgi:hypothetical protein
MPWEAFQSVERGHTSMDISNSDTAVIVLQPHVDLFHLQECSVLVLWSLCKRRSSEPLISAQLHKDKMNR